LKSTRLIAVLLAAALLAGCDSGISDELHSVLGPREAPKSRVFQADQRATYNAVKAAADEMGFRIVRGGPAEGELDALSRISEGDDPHSSHQVSMKVRLNPAADSGTEVVVSLTEMIEEPVTSEPSMSSPAGPDLATQTPLRDTPLYEVFFRNVQDSLSAPARK
jgi:hypothetical protein